jgi:glycosyltransferase involved in cell wall biosynthesis
MGTVAHQQARALAEAGVDVTVMTPRLSAARDRPRGVSVREVTPVLRRGNAACLPEVARLVGGYDLVHLHYPFFGTAEPLAMRRLLTGPPLILQYQMDVVAVSWKARLFHWHRRWVLPMILRAADAIIVSSRDYAESSFLSDHLLELRDRVHVIPNGVDLDLLDATRTGVDGELAGRLPGRPIVFFLAKLDRAHYFKGLHVLIEALTMLPEVSLLVGGDGESKRPYEQLARTRLGDRAQFVGDVPDELLPAYYRAADVVALPSTDRTEAFGLVLVEAMACGTPVVASRLPGVRTLVEEGKTGFLVEPGDAIDLAGKIRRCLEKGAAMRAGARAFVADRFSARAAVRQLLDLYQSLTTASPRRLGGTEDAAQRSVAML